MDTGSGRGKSAPLILRSPQQTSRYGSRVRSGGSVAAPPGRPRCEPLPEASTRGCRYPSKMRTDSSAFGRKPPMMRSVDPIEVQCGLRHERAQPPGGGWHAEFHEFAVSSYLDLHATTAGRIGGRANRQSPDGPRDGSWRPGPGVPDSQCLCATCGVYLRLTDSRPPQRSRPVRLAGRTPRCPPRARSPTRQGVRSWTGRATGHGIG
jgi:hypothetical protein